MQLLRVALELADELLQRSDARHFLRRHVNDVEEQHEPLCSLGYNMADATGNELEELMRSDAVASRDAINMLARTAAVKVGIAAILSEVAVNDPSLAASSMHVANTLALWSLTQKSDGWRGRARRALAPAGLCGYSTQNFYCVPHIYSCTSTGADGNAFRREFRST